MNYPEDTQTIYAMDLNVGDEFPSHDGLRHTVINVSEFYGDWLSVLVKKSNGETYTTGFDFRDSVRVLY